MFPDDLYEQNLSGYQNRKYNIKTPTHNDRNSDIHNARRTGTNC